MTYALTLNDDLRTLINALIAKAGAAAFVPRLSSETDKSGAFTLTPEAHDFEGAFYHLQVLADKACPTLLRELVAVDNRWIGSATRTPTEGWSPKRVRSFVRYLLNPRFAAERQRCVFLAGTAFSPFGMSNGEILDRLGMRNDAERFDEHRRLVA